MKKKLLAMALILVMMFALMPTGTQAAEAVPKKVTTAMRRAVTVGAFAEAIIRWIKRGDADV